MRDEMKHACRICTHSHRSHHKAELRDGRICQYLLNIKLAHSNGSRKQRGDRARHSDDVLCVVYCRVQWSRTCDEINTGGHHRGGMDQCGNGSWTRHRVRQPDVQRNLSGFTSHTDQHKQSNGSNHSMRNFMDLSKDRIELKAAKSPEHDEACDHKSEVTHTVDDESFLGGVRVCPGRPCQHIHFVPETDQKEGT